MINQPKPGAPSATTSFPGGRWAIALGIAMLVGFAIIAVLSALDREHRAGLESWEEVTGVEDRSYFSIPATLNPTASPTAKLAGKPLYLESMEPFGIHDSDVRKVAKDPETGLTIYRAADPKTAHLSRNGELYLLKIESGRYAKLRSAGP